MSGDVVTIERADVATQAPTATSEGAVILSMIDRLIARPDVAVEKLEQMFELHRKVQAEAARRAFYAALSELQSSLPTVAALGKITGEDKDKKEKVTRSRYAKWEDVNEAIRPHLTQHGFALSFRISQPADASRVNVTAVLSHREGHAEETSLHLPNDPSGGKNNVQAWGSSVSYGKRYTAFALLNIAARGEDDDGQRAGNGMITPAQIIELKALAKAADVAEVTVLERLSVETFDDISARQFSATKAGLITRVRQLKEGH
jgi:hypothetical protein